MSQVVEAFVGGSWRKCASDRFTVMLMLSALNCVRNLEQTPYSSQPTVAPRRMHHYQEEHSKQSTTQACLYPTAAGGIRSITTTIRKS